MASRKLGGGRVLGSGKGLQPPPPPPTAAAASPSVQRATSYYAQSDSTASLGSIGDSLVSPASGSPGSSSPLPDFPQDLTSRVSLAGPSAGASNGSKLVCPICEEEMTLQLTLLQLNRHIDDNHQELPEFQQDEVKTWFDKQVDKAKRFQPLSIINQKLRGLEVFESNESLPPPLRMNRSGATGIGGLTRDHTEAFTTTRKKRVERQTLEISRLEKRLTKLTQLLANPPADITAASNSGSSLLSPVASLSGQKTQRKAIEQSVVTWEDDAKVSKCPFCQQEFGSWTFRRHHCRICGRVVCADPQTACSSDVGLNVANPMVLSSEKPDENSISLDIRMCRECKFTIFAKRDFVESIVHKPPDQRAYETLRQFERGIQLLMPSFQRALMPLQDGQTAPSHAQIKEASKLRKRLIDSFTKYDMAARRLRDLKSESPIQQRLQKAIYQGASSFLHMHMLPLKNLPRMLKQSSSSSSGTRKFLQPNGHTASPLRNHHTDGYLETASQTSETSTVISTLETEEKDLRERLIVLEEQRYMVQKMIASSQGARRFEEVSALTRNVDELDQEIEAIKSKVSGVEERWQGLYANGGPGMV
ncbi:FYVE zinc finger [Apiospora saccharicola]